MKIIATYLLTILVLLQSLHINVGDVLHIQDFIEHAQFHKVNYGDNLISFISKHYGQEKNEHHKNHQEEKHEHEKLPFSGCSTLHAPVALLEHRFVSAIKRFDNFEKQDNFGYQINYISLTSFDIFQPPKSA